MSHTADTAVSPPTDHTPPRLGSPPHEGLLTKTHTDLTQPAKTQLTLLIAPRDSPLFLLVSRTGGHTAGTPSKRSLIQKLRIKSGRLLLRQLVC